MMDDWAMKRARELVEEVVPGNRLFGVALDQAALKAFAAYIREHETEPVDPDLIEAREIVADKSNDDCTDIILSGRWDGYTIVIAALAALKRGRELERGK